MIVRRLVLAAAALLCAGAAHADFTSAPVTTAYVGKPYVYDVAATGGGPVLITAPNGLPTWLTLEQTGDGTARLSGTPGPADSAINVLLRAEDTSCLTVLVSCYDYQIFDITIVPNTPPRVVPPGIADQAALEGTAFALDVSAAFEDPDGDPLTLTATGLPSGFALSGGVISGMPTVALAQGSPYTVSIVADDGRGGVAEDAFLLDISALDRADLAIGAISASPSPALAGDEATWTVTVENEGPDPSGAATLTIDVAGTEAALSGHACTLEATADAQRLVCPLEPIGAGESTSVTFAATVSDPGDVFVTATVAALGVPPIDPIAGNESGSGALNVGAEISAEAAQRVGEPSVAAAAGDFDADGYDDVVAAPRDAPAALHLNVENPGSLHPALSDSLDARRGLSTLPLSLGDGAASTGAAIADFDADGDLDAVVAAGAGAQAQLFVNDGSGALAPGAAFGSADADTRAAAASDFDGDGFPDVVLANAEENALYWNRGGAGFEAGALADSPGESADVAVVDLDGDARPDLVFANAAGDATRHPNGGGEFGAPAPLPTGPTVAVASGDLNGDGFADLVFARSVPGPSGLPSNPVFLNDGAGGFTLAAELGASPSVDVVVADVDGDERLDVVAINSTGAHQVFVNDGVGGFAQHPALFVANGAAAGAAARIGMRGSTDVVVAGEEGAAVFLNDGRGRLGLGDVGRPVIELIGAAEISVEVEQPYEDPGATVIDDVDGELTPNVDNPVDTKVLGTYVVTYTATDSAGNSAVPVTRTVRVEAHEASGGGGGGAVDVVLLALLGGALAACLSPLCGALPRGARRATRRIRRRAAAG